MSIYPLLWRYLTVPYLKIVALSTMAITALLVVMRLEETAKLAIIGASWQDLLRLQLLQLPHMLPIALPIACLVASYITLQRLSDSCELTALRAAHLSLLQILQPLIFTSCAIGLLSLFLTSEITTTSRLTAKKMLEGLSSANPLTLLQNPNFSKQKGLFVWSEERAENHWALALFSYNSHYQRMQAFLAEDTTFDGARIIAKHTALISYLPEKDQQQSYPDRLLIENADSSFLFASEILPKVRKGGWNISCDYLSMPALLCRREAVKEGRENKASVAEIDNEIIRRFAIGLSVIPFTLLGAAFAIQLSRHRRKRPLLFLLLISSLSLTTFVLAKQAKSYQKEMILFYVLPYLVMIVCSFKRLQNIQGGREG